MHEIRVTGCAVRFAVPGSSSDHQQHSFLDVGTAPVCPCSCFLTQPHPSRPCTFALSPEASECASPRCVSHADVSVSINAAHRCLISCCCVRLCGSESPQVSVSDVLVESCMNSFILLCLLKCKVSIKLSAKQAILSIFVYVK